MSFSEQPDMVECHSHSFISLKSLQEDWLLNSFFFFLYTIILPFRSRELLPCPCRRQTVFIWLLAHILKTTCGFTDETQVPVSELNILMSLCSQWGLSQCSQWQDLAHPDADVQSRLKKLQLNSAPFLPFTIKGTEGPQQSCKSEVQLPKHRCLVSSVMSHYIPPSL